MTPQASASSFPPKRTCAFMPLGGSVADHVTKRVPAPLATIEGLKSNEVGLRKSTISSIVAVSALTRYVSRYREAALAVRADLPELHGRAEDRRPVLSALALEAPVKRVEAVLEIRGAVREARLLR